MDNAIYRLSIDFSREGTLIIEDERYKVVEEIDPRYEEYFKKKGTTEVYIDIFENSIRAAKRKREIPFRNREWILTENDLPQSVRKVI